MKSGATVLLPRLLSLSLLFSFIPPSYQQSTVIPACASSCISNAIAEAGCVSGDRKCECSQPQVIQNFAEGCVLISCSSSDAIAAQDASEAICAAYIASVAANPASTTSSAAGSPTTHAASSAFTSSESAPQNTAAASSGGSSPVSTSSSSSSTFSSTSPTSGSSSSGSSSGSSGSGSSSSGSSSTLGSGSSRKKKGLATGAKAGIAVAAVAVVAIIAIFLFFMRRRKRADTLPPPVSAPAAESGPYKSELPTVEARNTAYTAMAERHADDLKDNTYAAVIPMQETKPEQGGVPNDPVSPQMNSPVPAYHHELSSEPGARIINVAEADSYAIPHSQEADSYAVPHGTEADSNPVNSQNYTYQPYTPYVPPVPAQEADSTHLQEKGIVPDVGRSSSQASNLTGVSGLSSTLAGSGSASGSKLDVLETRLEKVRQEKERLNKLQELEEMEKDLKEEVMAERRRAME